MSYQDHRSSEQSMSLNMPYKMFLGFDPNRTSHRLTLSLLVNKSMSVGCVLHNIHTSARMLYSIPEDIYYIFYPFLWNFMK
jgi:hypothetical protein